MTKNKGNREDRNDEIKGDNSGSTSSRAKRDRESGSEGSPATNKKHNKPATLNTSKGGEEIMDGGRLCTTGGKDSLHPRAPPAAVSAGVIPQDARVEAENPSRALNGNRRQLVESQLENKYNMKSLPPFIVFVECNRDAEPEGLNLGNMHPMAIARTICVRCGDSNITEIRSIGKMIQEITFRSFEAANRFVEGRDRLPKDWSTYIPNFRIRRVGVVRGVDPSLSEKAVREGI